MDAVYKRMDELVEELHRNGMTPGLDWKLCETFQCDILSAIITKKYGRIMHDLGLVTDWKSNTYYNEASSSFDKDAWFGLMFYDGRDDYDMDYGNFNILLRFHYDFDRVVNDCEYRRRVIETITGPITSRNLWEALHTYHHEMMIYYQRATLAMVVADKEDFSGVSAEIPDIPGILGTTDYSV